MLEAINRPGVWRNAGMSGVIVGLDVAGALAGMPGNLDTELCKRLLIEAEAAFVSAWQAHNMQDEGKGKDGGT